MTVKIISHGDDNDSNSGDNNNGNHDDDNDNDNDSENYSDNNYQKIVILKRIFKTGLSYVYRHRGIELRVT